MHLKYILKSVESEGMFKLYLILFFCQSIFIDHSNVLYSDMGKIYINSYDKYPYMHTQFQSC